MSTTHTFRHQSGSVGLQGDNGAQDETRNYGIPDPVDVENVVTFSRFRRHKRYGEALLVSFAVCCILIFTICVAIVYCKRRLYLSSFEKLSDNYIYKPLQGGQLDKQYENTFVGVDVPLLQEISVI